MPGGAGPLVGVTSIRKLTRGERDALIRAGASEWVRWLYTLDCGHSVLRTTPTPRRDTPAHCGFCARPPSPVTDFLTPTHECRYCRAGIAKHYGWSASGVRECPASAIGLHAPGDRLGRPSEI